MNKVNKREEKEREKRKEKGKEAGSRNRGKSFGVLSRSRTFRSGGEVARVTHHRGPRAALLGADMPAQCEAKDGGEQKEREGSERGRGQPKKRVREGVGNWTTPAYVGNMLSGRCHSLRFLPISVIAKLI